MEAVSVIDSEKTLQELLDSQKFPLVNEYYSLSDLEARVDLLKIVTEKILSGRNINGVVFDSTEGQCWKLDSNTIHYGLGIIERMLSTWLNADVDELQKVVTKLGLNDLVLWRVGSLKMSPDYKSRLLHCPVGTLESDILLKVLVDACLQANAAHEAGHTVTFQHPVKDLGLEKKWMQVGFGSLAFSIEDCRNDAWVIFRFGDVDGVVSTLDKTHIAYYDYGFGPGGQLNWVESLPEHLISRGAPVLFDQFGKEAMRAWVSDVERRMGLDSVADSDDCSGLGGVVSGHWALVNGAAVTANILDQYIHPDTDSRVLALLKEQWGDLCKIWDPDGKRVPRKNPDDVEAKIACLRALHLLDKVNKPYQEILVERDRDNQAVHQGISIFGAHAVGKKMGENMKEMCDKALEEAPDEIRAELEEHLSSQRGLRDIWLSVSAVEGDVRAAIGKMVGLSGSLPPSPLKGGHLTYSGGSEGPGDFSASHGFAIASDVSIVDPVDTSGDEEEFEALMKEFKMAQMMKGKEGGNGVHGKKEKAQMDDRLLQLQINSIGPAIPVETPEHGGWLSEELREWLKQQFEQMREQMTEEMMQAMSMMMQMLMGDPDKALGDIEQQIIAQLAPHTAPPMMPTGDQPDNYADLPPQQSPKVPIIPRIEPPKPTPLQLAKMELEKRVKLKTRVSDFANALRFMESAGESHSLRGTKIDMKKAVGLHKAVKSGQALTEDNRRLFHAEMADKQQQFRLSVIVRSQTMKSSDLYLLMAFFQEACLHPTIREMFDVEFLLSQDISMIPTAPGEKHGAVIKGFNENFISDCTEVERRMLQMKQAGSRPAINDDAPSIRLATTRLVEECMLIEQRTGRKVVPLQIDLWDLANVEHDPLGRLLAVDREFPSGRTVRQQLGSMDPSRECERKLPEFFGTYKEDIARLLEKQVRELLDLEVNDMLEELSYCWGATENSRIAVTEAMTKLEGRAFGIHVHSGGRRAGGRNQELLATYGKDHSTQENDIFRMICYIDTLLHSMVKSPTNPSGAVEAMRVERWRL